MIEQLFEKYAETCFLDLGKNKYGYYGSGYTTAAYRAFEHCYKKEKEKQRGLRKTLDRQRDQIDGLLNALNFILVSSNANTSSDFAKTAINTYRKSMLLDDKERCAKAPEGWRCNRAKDHEGPCAASEIV